jgi:hypothetical protein
MIHLHGPLTTVAPFARDEEAEGLIQHRTLLIVGLVLAAVAAGPGWSLSAPLPAASEEASFRLAGASAASDDDDGVTVTSRRSPLAAGQMAGPMERPLSLATADEPASDHPGAGARAPRIAVQRR